MKTLKSIIFSFSLLCLFGLNAQDMTQGFKYLETGKYTKAEIFFEAILEQYPDLKTARLCYGRAIGLNGKTEAAKNLFTSLLNDYPSDFEVKLNYGESLLWNSDFEAAEKYYRDLVEEKGNNFSALLGLANTLSNLKVYEEALIYIQKALEVSPSNQNAMTSMKYIYLGYAYQNQQEQNYNRAEAILMKGLNIFSEDKDLLMNLANLYLIWEKYDYAEVVYKRLKKQPLYNTQALNGLALVAHLKGDNKQALALSSKAYEDLNTTTEAKLRKQTTERYIQALIWAKDYQLATLLIEDLIKSNPNSNWVLALRATLNIYKSNFKKSLSDYNMILSQDNTSFDGNLGKANALKALGRNKEAFKAAENTLKYYENQKDATNFINQLNIKFSPTLSANASHTFDNGNNEAYAVQNSIVFPLSTKVSLLGNYNYRTTQNTITENKAVSNDASMGVAYTFMPNITFKGIAGVTSASAKTQDFTQLTTDLSLNITSLKLQSLDIGYKRQVESFNADLLDRELVQNNYYANYNLSTNFNLGWFTQYIFTSQNDSNSRNLLFTSVYYELLKKPILKAGFNYQYITFKDQLPSIYFSPEQFNATELFLNLVKDEAITKPKSFYYNATAAFGYQFIEDQSAQTTYRLQGTFGYKFSDRALLNLYGTHSNIASATAAGFTFTELGIGFKWVLWKARIKAM